MSGASRSSEMPATFRQSLLRAFDACPLAAKMGVEYNGPDWSIAQAALGTAFHSVAAEMVATMRRTGEIRISTQEAIEIMYELLAKPDAPHLSHEDMADLRIMVLQFCNHQWDAHRVLTLEEGYELAVVCPDGVTRIITGQPDLVTADPPKGAIIIDYKSGFAKPPAPKDDDWMKDDGRPYLSKKGTFQLDVYSLLVMRVKKLLDYCVLREYHARWDLMRDAIVRRKDLEHIERRVGIHLMQLDRVLSGEREAEARPGWWCKPTCPRPSACPIPGEERREGALITVEDAVAAGCVYTGARAVADRTEASIKAFLEEEANPIDIGDSLVGWKEKPGARQISSIHERWSCPTCGAPKGQLCVRPVKGGWQIGQATLRNPHKERWMQESPDFKTATRSFGVYKNL